MSGVEAEGDPINVDAARTNSVKDDRQFLGRRPHPEPATRRVLEHDSRGIRPASGFGQCAGHGLCDPLRTRRDARSAVRPRMHIHEARPVGLGG